MQSRWLQTLQTTFTFITVKPENRSNQIKFVIGEYNERNFGWSKLTHLSNFAVITPTFAEIAHAAVLGQSKHHSRCADGMNKRHLTRSCIERKMKMKWLEDKIVDILIVTKVVCFCHVNFKQYHG